MKLELQKEFYYSDIEEFANKNNFSITEYGKCVGRNFIVLDHNEKDITISFVLTGASSRNYIYTLIYKDEF